MVVYAWVGFVGRMRLGRRRTEGADVGGSAGKKAVVWL